MIMARWKSFNKKGINRRNAKKFIKERDEQLKKNWEKWDEENRMG